MSNSKPIEIIKEFIKQRDWEQFHDPKNLAISLNLESSEVLELFQWTKDNEINKNRVTNLKDELADVYYWLLLLADHYDIDIEKALEEKIKKNEKKYPIDKSKGSSEKYSEFN
jgi:NTP pyrophosphatase (non-canonical NTP hydrolase)